MKATIIVIFLLASSCMVFGQKENTNDNKNEAAKQEKEQKEDEKEDGLKAVSKVLAEEKKKNKELSDSIKELTQDKKQIEEQLKKENSAKLHLLKDTINSLKEKNIQIQKVKDAAVEEKDKIKDRLSRYEEIDRKVYNLFLLHTLEIRYNEKYIKDAKYCLDSLKIGENPKYKKEYEIYYPLIEKYP